MRGVNASTGEPPDAPKPDMAWVPPGTFSMGSDRHYPEEAPVRRVSVDGFWIDRYEVTNRQFAQFVDATGHITFAERSPDPGDYPGAKPELLVPASSVFVQPEGPVDLANQYNWWTYVPGADWRHPYGADSSIECLEDNPVVHVAWEDVEAYARWAGKELPTEAEGERACRGGLGGAESAWAGDLPPAAHHMSNIWQAEFPLVNEQPDGYRFTSPVGSFSA